MIGFYAAGATGEIGPPPVPTTWDATAKGANVVLSSGDLVATKSGGGWQTTFGTVGKSSGKWQFEIVFVAGSSTNRPFASLSDKTNIANLMTTYTGNPGATTLESMGYWGNGTFYWNLTTGTSPTGVAVPGTSVTNVITVTLDLTQVTPEAQFYLNGSLQRTQSLPSGKTWYPATSLQGGGSVRLVPSSLTHPQSGFTDWG